MAQSNKIPPIEWPLLFIGKGAEAVVDSLAKFMKAIVDATPAFKHLSEREREAIAYALVGDLIASPIPEPLDTPIDVVVQERLRTLMPNINKYVRTATRIAEYMPVLELLPNYTLSVLSAIRERETEGTKVTALQKKPKIQLF